MGVVSMVLSDIKEGPDPEAEKYLDKHDEWPWYTLKAGITLTDELEGQLERIGYVNLGEKDGFIYDEIADERTELHNELIGPPHLCPKCNKRMSRFIRSKYGGFLAGFDPDGITVWKCSCGCEETEEKRP